MHKEKGGTLMRERGECVSVPVPTPCINVCRLDEAAGLCLGCARTGAEIAAWADADAPFKRGVWDALPPRRARLGMAVYRLPWTAAEIGAFIESTLRNPSGRWVLGAHGAGVSFAIRAGEAVEIASTPETVTAVTGRGALRLSKHEKSIALAFGSAADPLGPEAIGLVLPRGRVILREGARLDEAAIAEADRCLTLQPLVPARDLATWLYIRSPHAGTSPEPPESLIASVAARRAQLVAETGLGRAEVFEASDGDGPAFDFDPARLAEGRELPPGWTLDCVFALGALFYPRPRTGEAE
jgi:predicted Fe-S protein YdhL (DUF1289 family)